MFDDYRIYTPHYLKYLSHSGRKPYKNEEIAIMRLEQNQKIMFNKMIKDKKKSSMR